MLASKRDKILNATRNAADKFAKAAQRDADFVRERERLHQLDAAKTAKLKAMRLAKEAADRETAAQEAASAVPRLVKRTRKGAA
ncbi:MAG TPA: hypothetical protein VID77_07045 [Stellaceae bacterium]|jgi:hypothetical protein